MAISFNTVDVSSLQHQNHHSLRADKQLSAAPAIAHAQDEHAQRLTGRPVEAPGSTTETKHINGSHEDESIKSSRNLSTDAQLNEAEKRQLEELRARDRQVRAHEQAHLGAAGGLATGGASYTTQRGPDGQLYAVGGEVSIDTSTVSNDPEATIQKAQQIRRAALAPADPSAQDLAVAAQATIQEQEARSELAEQRVEETRAATGVNRADESGTTANDTQSDSPDSVYRSIETHTEEPSALVSKALDLFA